MKVLIIFIGLCMCCCQVQGQRDIRTCLPQPSVVVPIQGIVKNTIGLSLCNATSGRITKAFSGFLTEQSETNFNSPSKSCKLSDVQEISCNIHGRNNRRTSFKFSATLTCGDGCDEYESDTQALKFIHSKRNDLRSAYRTKSIAEVSYLGRTVVMHYFQGRKGAISVTCDTSTVRSIKDKYPLCDCPNGCQQGGSKTPSVCSLLPETGLCRGHFQRFFYNSTSKQCEGFVYGGCGGNENNFESTTTCQTKCKDKKEKQCPKGKVFQECGTACPSTCDNKDQLTVCTLQCVMGCFCPPGTMELGDKCVTVDQCPTESPATKAQQCPKGKVFQECGTACPKTCDNTDRIVPCTRQCVQGCFCPSGTVELGDKCVTADQCPTESPATEAQQCPEGKVFQECGTACSKTCDNKNKPPTFCTLQCVQGCFCPNGTVELGDKCVTADQCPTESPATKAQQCPEGKVFQECGTACPKTCDNKDRIVPCTLQCVQGCFCPTGKVQSEDQCVDVAECKV